MVNMAGDEEVGDSGVPAHKASAVAEAGAAPMQRQDSTEILEPSTSLEERMSKSAAR